MLNSCYGVFDNRSANLLSRSFTQSFFVSSKILKTPLTTDSTDHRSNYRGRAYSQSTGAHDAPVQKRGTGRVADDQSG